MQAFYTEAILISEQNLEIVRRLVEAFFDRDAETVASILDDEVEFESALVEHKSYKGKAGAMEYRGDLDEAWGEWRSEGDRFLPAGSERVVHLYRIVGQGRGSGVPVAQDIAILWTLRAGRVVRGKGSSTRMKPSKLAGWRSRRCRRRAWNW
jgi:ketosteroid isomerase-like protein